MIIGTIKKLGEVICREKDFSPVVSQERLMKWDKELSERELVVKHSLDAISYLIISIYPEKKVEYDKLKIRWREHPSYADTVFIRENADQLGFVLYMSNEFYKQKVEYYKQKADEDCYL